jgi:ankyrin repeat protein
MLNRYTLVLAGLVMASSFASASVLDAVTAKDAQQLARAIAAGHPVDEKNAAGQTLLLVAVWNNDIASAKLLLEAGADVNAKDTIQDSPYLVAGAHGRVEILKMILKHGADLKSTNRYGGTALIPAAEKGHPEAVSLLIEAGVDVNHVNNLGWTALMEAVVLSNGGPIHQDIIRRLLDGGADKTIPDSNGVTALEHAKARGFAEIIQILQD